MQKSSSAAVEQLQHSLHAFAAEIPCYFYPFLKPCGDDKHMECVRTTTLGVLNDLTKFDDPHGSHALCFFLESEVVPLCLKCIDVYDKKSQKLATLIVMNILTQESGLTYCSATPECFFSIVQVLRRVVEKLSLKTCLLHLEYVIQCYVCVSKIYRSIGPCDELIRQIPPQLFDNTFRRTLLHNHEASWMLQVLLSIFMDVYIFRQLKREKGLQRRLHQVMHQVQRVRERERSEVVL
uniref:Cell differentiation protein rcd1 n=1 Tax=Solanum lycopersicum TaxID=4081 RepID=K4CF80_SOLLC